MNTNSAGGPDLTDFFARCEGQIREQGCVIIWVGSDPSEKNPPFAYTVGLSERYKRPELLVFGFMQDEALTLLNSLVRRFVRPGFYVPLDQPVLRILECPVIVKAVTLERARPYARFAISRCEALGLSCVVQQVVVPDASGVFPWESAYDKRYLRAQPKLFELQ
jgi:uncharacterized protein DUF4262